MAQQGFFENLFGGGSENQAQMAQSYGVPPEIYQQLLRQQRAQTLTQVGGTLLAASQPGQIGDRGRHLAQLGNVGGGGDFNKNLLNSQQMRLYAESLKDKQDERARREQARESLRSRQDLTPQQQALAQADPFGFLQSEQQNLAAVQRQQMLAEQEQAQAIQGYVQAGVPEDVARGLVSGALQMGEDAMGRPTLVSVNDMLQRAQQPAPEAPPIGTSMPTVGTQGQPIDYSDATGTSGVLKQAANTIGGVFGGEPYPETERAASALQQLGVETNMALTADVPGRPSNLTREYIQSLIVSPANLRQGDARSLAKFGQLQSMIQSEIERMSSSLQTIPMSTTERANVMSNLRRLQGLKKSYDTVIQNFGQQQTQQAPQGSTTPDANRRGRYNPQTGQVEWQ